MLISGVGLTLPYTCQVPDDATVEGDDANTQTLNTNKLLAETCDKEKYGKMIGTAFVARDVKAIAEALGEDGLIRYAGKFLGISNYESFLTIFRLLLRYFAWRNDLCNVSRQD
jgi:hypothetical protein